MDKVLFNQIKNNIEEFFHDIDSYSNVYQISRKDAEIELDYFSKMREKAKGNYNAREYVINQYTKVLGSDLFNIDEVLDELISIKDIESNSIDVIFEMLLDIYDISEILDKYNIDTTLNKNTVIKIANDEKRKLNNHFKDKTSRIKLIARLIYSKTYGQDCIDTLQYHNINDLGFLRKDYIYITYKSKKIHLEFLKFDNENTLFNIQKKNTSNSTMPYNEENISTTTSKDNSSRVAVAGFELTPFDDDYYYNERIFNLRQIKLEELKDDYQMFNDLIYELLYLNMEGRGTHFVTGAEMTIGKSTLLLAMMEKIPKKWAIGILDPQNEIQAHLKYKNKNIMTFIESSKRTLDECFELALKFSRDILYVSETTRPNEVERMVEASLRLNAGVGTTMHSFSPEDVIPNLRNLLMRGKMYKDSYIAESDVSKAIDIIIHLSRLNDGKIVIDSISEVINIQDDNIIFPNYKGNLKDKISNLTDMFQHYLYKKMTNSSYRINTLIKYDRDKNDWIVKNSPSDRYLKKLSLYCDQGKIEKLKEKFNTK